VRLFDLILPDIKENDRFFINDTVEASLAKKNE
jgi:hypothetical protein